MFDFPIRIPHLIIFLTAASWILFLYFQKPDLLSKRPLLVSLIEAFMLGLAWAFFLTWTTEDPLEGLIGSSLLTSSLWFGFVYYSRFRYAKSILPKA
jgi:hypothetical protein